MKSVQYIHTGVCVRACVCVCVCTCVCACVCVCVSFKSARKCLGNVSGKKPEQNMCKEVPFDSSLLAQGHVYTGAYVSATRV